MSVPLLGHKTIKALHGLKDAGEKSFEALIANLVAQYICKPIRLCKSGYQAGMDAVGDSIALEMKRYGPETALKQRELQGEITDAALQHPQLELWVLITTQDVDAQLKLALEKSAASQGLFILILDNTAAQPELSQVSSVAALCACYPGTTLDAISDPDWHDTKQDRSSIPPISEVEEELRTIQALPGFPAWRTRFQQKLREPPLWSLMRERQNQRLAKLLQQESHITFGTHFDVSQAVPRTAKQHIEAWWQQAKDATEPATAVVLGERYDGKTWCVFDWLRERLPTLPVPVFVLSSQRGNAGDKELRHHILDDMKRVLGQYERHAETILQRQLTAKHTKGPWGLIILDGVNEYAPNSNRWLDHLAWATGRLDLSVHPCAVLVTVRQQSWVDFAPSVKTKIRQIFIRSYDVTEFQAALTLRGLPANYLTSIPTTAHEMVHRPRYFSLVIQHQDKLERYEAVTPEILLWLDACDKIGRFSATYPPGFDEEHYQGVLKDLASRYVAQRGLKLTEVRNVIGGYASEIEKVLQDLRSEGVLLKTGPFYEIHGERLALGMGLYLCERLALADRQQKNLVEYLRDELAPWQEMEEVIAWLRAATTVALLSDSPTSEPIIDTLVNEWLRSRNLASPDLQAMDAMDAWLLEPLLRLACQTWSFAYDHSRLQELSRMRFARALTDPDRTALVSDAIRTWWRWVPTSGSSPFEHHMQKQGQDPAATIRENLAEPDITDLQLTACGDAGILRLHRVGFYLLSREPELIDADDLLALMGTVDVAEHSLDSGEWWIIRHALARVSTTWFKQQAASLPIDVTSRRRKMLHWLLCFAERDDLQALREATAPPPDPLLERWQALSLLDVARYQAVRTHPFAPDEQPMRFLALARQVVRDPALPQPCAARIEIMREVVAQEYASIALLTRGAYSIEEHQFFKEMLSAIAAWMPEVGTTIIRRQLEGFPSRLPEERLGWTFRIREDAVLLDSTVCPALTPLLTEADALPHPQYTKEFLKALLPGMAPLERLEAFLNRSSQSLEYTDLYNLMWVLITDDIKATALERMRLEADPLQLCRLLYLLRECDNVVLTESDIQALIATIQHGQHGDQCAALALAIRHAQAQIPLTVLFPLLQETSDDGSWCPGYASWLMFHSEEWENITYEDLAHWPLQWRAKAAATRADFRERFLREIDRALVTSRGAAPRSVVRDDLSASIIVTFPEKNEEEPLITLDLQPSSQSLHGRIPELTTGGVAGSALDMQTVFERMAEERNQPEVADAKHRKLQERVRSELMKRDHDPLRYWFHHPFPQALVDDLHAQKPRQFEQWIDALLANEHPTAPWYGLSMAMFRVALRIGHPRTKELWDLVYPFQRGPTGRGVRFIHEDGIDWVLHDLSSPEVQDTTAASLLTDLIRETESDWELFCIALGARRQKPERLQKIVTDLLRDAEAATRARALRLAGWLGGMSSLITHHVERDPSLWVRRVGILAQETQALEHWAQHWFSVFINVEQSPDIRWGAGQLFLACVDSRFKIWAQPLINRKALDSRTCGEAVLLLEAARYVAEKAESQLRETFLLHTINDLRSVCYPWHPEVQWHKIL